MSCKDGKCSINKVSGMIDALFGDKPQKDQKMINKLRGYSEKAPQDLSHIEKPHRCKVCKSTEIYWDTKHKRYVCGNCLNYHKEDFIYGLSHFFQKAITNNWYKMSQQEKIVSFDFDHTIWMNTWLSAENDYERDENGNMTGYINNNTVSLMNEYNGKGYNVIIVTSRHEFKLDEVRQIVKKYSLPVENIYCTNGNLKVNLLKNLGAIIHYDDSLEEIDAINSQSDIQGILV